MPYHGIHSTDVLKDNCFYSLKYLDKLTMLALCSQHVLSAASLNHLTVIINCTDSSSCQVAYKDEAIMVAIYMVK